MAPIDVVCVCGKRFAVHPSHAGKTIRCPGCRQPITVPGPAAPPSPPGAAPIGRYQAPLSGPEPACYGVVAAIAWIDLGLSGLWLLAAIIASGGEGRDRPPALLSLPLATGGFIAACLFAAWSLLAVDIARTLRAILDELRRHP